MDKAKVVNQLIDVWESSEASPSMDVLCLLARDTPVRQQADAVLIDQRYRWQKGEVLSAEEYFRNFQELEADEEIRLDIIYGEFLARGEKSSLLTEFIRRFPELERELTQQFAVSSWLDSSLQLSDESRTQKMTDSIALLKTVEIPAGDFDPAPLQFSDFDLCEQLGKGSMGAVHRAIQKSLNKPVAVKLLTRHDRASTAFNERFLREARTTASLNHPNIVDVHGVGRCPDGGYFLVMDLVEGVSLQSVLADGPLEVDRAVQVALEIASALKHVHEHGVIHRDLKPGNVIHTPEGNNVLVDFGLARLLNSEDQQLTHDGEIIGTPSFMAPEQVESQRGPVSAATDIYGLGGLLYAMLTGRPPVAGGSVVQTVAEILSNRPVRCPTEFRQDIPIPLVELCTACLQKEPSDRPASAAEIWKQLKDWQEAQDETDNPVSRPMKSRTSAKPGINVLSGRLLVTATVGLLLVGVLFYAQDRVKETIPPVAGGGDTASEVPPTVSPAPPTPGRAVSLPDTDVDLSWNLEVFDKEGSELDSTSLGYVTNDHRIRINIALKEHRYAYVYWVGSDGSIAWLNDDRSPVSPVTELSFPANGRDVHPVGGAAGTEFCVLLLRNEPLSEPEQVAQLLKPPAPLPAFELDGYLADGVPVLSGDDTSRKTIAKLNGERRILEEAEPLFAGTAEAAVSEWKKRWPQNLGYLHFLAIPHRESK